MTQPAIAPQFFRLENGKALLDEKPPCVTIFLPRYAPGAAARPDSVWLRNTLKAVDAELEKQHVPPQQIREMLKPLERLTAEDTFEQGNERGTLIFRGPLAFERYTLAENLEGFAVGPEMYVLPLLRTDAIPREFFILGLSKGKIELFRVNETGCARMPLPAGMPENLEAALEFEPFDHDRDNRSAAGTSLGKMRSVRFGTGDESESRDSYLHQFLMMVDRGLKPVTNDATVPVVPAGVHYEVAEFLRVTANPAVVREGAIEGNVDDMPVEELEAAARKVLMDRHTNRVHEAVERMRETPNKRALGLLAVHQAALAGRVWRLFVEAVSPQVWLQRWREYSELNRVVVEVLRKGGEVMVVEEKLPDDVSIAAQLRY